MTVVKTPCEASYENTIMFECRVEGILKAYEIHPVNGYILHDNRIDTIIYNEETWEEIDREPWYTQTYITVRFDYDFVKNPENIYAVLRDSIG